MNERTLFSDNTMPNLKMLLLPRNTTSQQKNTFHLLNTQIYRKEKKMLRGSRNIKSGNLTGNIELAPIDVIGVVRVISKDITQHLVKEENLSHLLCLESHENIFSIPFDPPHYNEVYIKRSFKVMRDQIYPIKNS